MQSQLRLRALASLMAVALLSLASIAAAMNEATALTGTVVSVNRDLSYITVRDDVTGRNFKIDTRDLSGRRSIDIGRLRAGDRISAMGAWENSETWRANRVTFANPQALGRLANGVTGTVEDIRGHSVALFLEVTDIDAVEQALSGLTPVVPRRPLRDGAPAEVLGEGQVQPQAGEVNVKIALLQPHLTEFESRAERGMARRPPIE